MNATVVVVTALLLLVVVSGSESDCHVVFDQVALNCQQSSECSQCLNVTMDFSCFQDKELLTEYTSSIAIYGDCLIPFVPEIEIYKKELSFAKREYWSIVGFFIFALLLIPIVGVVMAIYGNQTPEKY